ncbi:MAG TPA: hypothetical protein VFQ27_10480 [Xanthobacteraceae bacterium]|nr:hypothetical protein [Xanthobacteraceae bacterium]
MNPGGTVEIIWHFAGYLHLAIEDLRVRLEYEEGPNPYRPADFTAKLPHYEFSPDFASINPYGLGPPLPSFEPEFFHVRAMPHKIGRLPTDLDRFKVPQPHDVEKLPPGGGIGGGGAQIEVVYDSAGSQTLSDIDQLNRMSDDDQFGISKHVDVEEIHGIDIDATLDRFELQAAAEVPAEIALPSDGGGQAVAEFIRAQDAITQQSGGEDGTPPAEPGLYINGVLQPEGSERPQTPVVEEQPPDLDAKGQWATLGENVASNAAVIIDLNESAPTLMVLGDYFSTNGIVQTNIFTDNDEVHLGDQPPEAIHTGGNTADNIAEIVEKEGIHGVLAGNFSGWSWHVDIVDGDFFDTNLFTQKNYLGDNDIIAQDSSATHFQLVAGANGQENLAGFFNEMSKYDAIIVGGDYHGANLIFQTNILLDDDILKLVAGESHPSAQFASTGDNALLNDATIVTYGNDDFQPFAPGMDALVAALGGHQNTLDPSYGNLIPGNGPGPLNILYITGDYYDINALWQINVVADLDLAIQLLSGAPPEEGEFTQWAATGGNSLSNLAGIVDVGSTFTFLKGAPYEDTILVQANLVTDDKDAVLHQDTNTLVSEVVAFIGADEPEDQPTENAPPVLHPPDDVMGSVLT